MYKKRNSHEREIIHAFKFTDVYKIRFKMEKY
jgi:hypothetical protein